MSQAIPTVPPGFSAMSPWINTLFKLWSERWQVWVLQGAIISLIPAVFTTVMTVAIVGTMPAIIAAQHDGKPPNLDVLWAYVPLALGFVLVAAVVAGLAYTALYPGMVRTALRQLRGQPTSVGDLFTGLDVFGPMLVYGLLTLLLGIAAAIVGLLACCVGIFATGLLLAGALIFAVPLIVDRRLGGAEAIGASWQTAKQHIVLFTLFLLIIGIIIGAISQLAQFGALFLPLQLVLTFAIQAATAAFLPLAQSIAYVSVYEQPVAMMSAAAGAPPPPPYAPPTNPIHGCRWCGAPLAPGQTHCGQCGRADD